MPSHDLLARNRFERIRLAVKVGPQNASQKVGVVLPGQRRLMVKAEC